MACCAAWDGRARAGGPGGQASVVYDLWHGIAGNAADRWYGEATVDMIVALTPGRPSAPTPSYAGAYAARPKASSTWSLSYRGSRSHAWATSSGW